MRRKIKLKEILAAIFLLSSVSWRPSHGDCDVLAPNAVNVIEYGAIGDGIPDDSHAFLEAWEAVCRSVSSAPPLYIPPGRVFLLNPVKFQGPCMCPEIYVEVLGNIVAPSNSIAWDDPDNCLVFFNVRGLTAAGDGQIDGNGTVWWALGKNKRPTALALYNCSNLELDGLTHINSPRNHISVYGSDNVLISNIHIATPESSPNTDGIDISHSSNVLIQYCIVGTGDDCIAVGGGSSYISLKGIKCGPGHGISIGSLGPQGRTDMAEEVHVRDCSFIGTMNGVRIKTWQEGSGYARKISFEGITLEAADNPIIIDQYYCIENVDGCKNQTSAVEVNDVLYSGVHGTSITNEAVKISCSQTIGCTNIVFDDIYITSAYTGTSTRSAIFNARGLTSGPSVPALNGLLPSTYL